MASKWTAAPFAALALALTAGCSAPVAPGPTPTPESGEASMCETFRNGFEAYTDWIGDAATGSVDVDEFYVQERFVEDLRASAPADAARIVDAYAEPVDAVGAVVADGGGSLDFSTVGYKAANLELLQLCGESEPES